MDKQYSPEEVLEELWKHEAGCDRRHDEINKKFTFIGRSIFYTVGVATAFLGILITIFTFLGKEDSPQPIIVQVPYPVQVTQQPAVISTVPDVVKPDTSTRQESSK